MKPEALRFEIGRMTLGPDDVLVLKIRGRNPQHVLDLICGQAKLCIPDGRKVMVLDDQCDLQILSFEDKAKLAEQPAQRP